MQGKVVLITGATAGIGQAAALALAQQGATVVLGARNPEKAQRTVQQITKLSGQTPEVLLGDLVSLKQVRQMARQFEQRWGQLDVLINNAGLQTMQRQLTSDGFELTFQVNYLSHFLLTQLLQPLLQQSPQARIVNVASLVHRWARWDWPGLATAVNFEGNRAYSNSKLAMIYFTYALAQRLPASVGVNAMEPGLVDTEFARDFKGVMRLGNWMVSPFKQTPAQGADTVVYLASSPQVAGVSGKYFAKRKAIASSKASYDADKTQQLWQQSMKWVGLD